MKYSIPFVLFSSSETMIYMSQCSVLYIYYILSHDFFPLSSEFSAFILSVICFGLHGSLCLFKFCCLILLSLCGFMSFLKKSAPLSLPNNFLKFFSGACSTLFLKIYADSESSACSSLSLVSVIYLQVPC